MAQNQLEQLEARLAQIRAKIQRIRAREQAKERKRDTRRKILVGGAILAKVERGEWSRERLTALMDAVLTRDDDRALFGLPPRPRQTTD